MNTVNLVCLEYQFDKVLSFKCFIYIYYLIIKVLKSGRTAVRTLDNPFLRLTQNGNNRTV